MGEKGKKGGHRATDPSEKEGENGYPIRISLWEGGTFPLSEGASGTSPGIRCGSCSHLHSWLGSLCEDTGSFDAFGGGAIEGTREKHATEEDGSWTEVSPCAKHRKHGPHANQGVSLNPRIPSMLGQGSTVPPFPLVLPSDAYIMSVGRCQVRTVHPWRVYKNAPPVLETTSSRTGDFVDATAHRFGILVRSDPQQGQKLEV